MKKLLSVLLAFVMMVGFLPVNAFAVEFSDVPTDSYCYKPVLWAVERGITNGTSDTQFSPDNQCIRRHVVMFLWRAMGKPEPSTTENPFPDVKHDSFEKAILWAVEKGITAGFKDGSFRPDDPCSRKQIVMFLWRNAGKPEPASMDNIFPDVKHDQFEKAILWAVSNGITNGFKDGSFGPEKTCTRGQIVAFLYRAENGSPSTEHTHQYTDTVVPPTCTEQGYTEHKCSCGDSYRDTYVNSLGHTWTEASCTAPRTCSVCGATEGVALGHDYVRGICTRCGEKDPNSAYGKVYEDNRVTIYYTGYTQDGITFDVENKTSRCLTIQANTIALNGCSTERIIMSDAVSPQSVGEIVAKCNPPYRGAVGTVSGSLRIIDWDDSSFNYNAIFVNAIVNPSISVAPPAVTDTLAYTDDNVDIYYKSVDEEGVHYLLRNKTNIVVTIQANAVSINNRSTGRIIMSDAVSPQSVGEIVAKCKINPIPDHVTKVGGSLRVINFDNSFNSYDAEFYNVEVGKGIHIHSWKDATCTEPKTCSICGTTEGVALGHNYVNGVCTRCGEDDPNYINGMARLGQFLVENGQEYSPNSYKIQNSTSVNGYEVIGEISYSSKTRRMLFKTCIEDAITKTDVTYFYDPAVPISSGQIDFLSTNKQPVSMPPFSSASAHFDISTFTVDTKLEFTERVIGYTPELNNLANTSVQVAVLQWQALCESAGVTLQEIGFTAY